jgi:hypothetical protein
METCHAPIGHDVVATNRHDLTLAKVATQAGCLVKDAEDAPGEMKIRLHQTEEQN